MTMSDTTELYRSRPPGEMYRLWTTVHPMATQEWVDQLEGLDQETRRQMKICLRVAPFYRWLVPPAAVALQDQLDSNAIAIGHNGVLLNIEQTAALFGVGAAEVHEAMHELHAAALIVMNEEGEFCGQIPEALRPVTNPGGNSGRNG